MPCLLDACGAWEHRTTVEDTGLDELHEAGIIRRLTGLKRHSRQVLGGGDPDGLALDDVGYGARNRLSVICEQARDLRMPRNGLYGTGRGIGPERMGAAFTLSTPPVES